jgi:hypothetical protein
VRYPWRKIFQRIIKGEANSITLLRFTQRISGWLILAVSFLLVASGLGWNNLGFWRDLPFNPHVRVDVFMSITLILHVGISSKIALKRLGMSFPSQNTLIVSGILLLLVSGFFVDSTLGRMQNEPADSGTSTVPTTPNIESPEKDPDTATPIPGVDYDTKPVREGKIKIGSETFEFNPSYVKTTRPDIFQPGYFSIFDVLVHVADDGHIELQTHFEDSMNTHVIDSINGEENWWFMVFYEGGWSENNYFRPDHYPWKDGTTLRFFKTRSETLELAYDIFKEEVERKNNNDGKVIIPRVIIDGPKTQKEFQNVEVTAHNLREDVFQSGVITAIDVILSLSDEGKLRYDLQWYESIGTAGVVKNYWVEGIDDDIAYGRCGFVYESGSNKVRGFAGNHIHLPSDTRVINSPEYVLYFWICI